MTCFIRLFAALMLCGTALFGAEKKHFSLYATLTEAVSVTLADGPKWIMVKGATFPVLMFKEQQTKVVLQLAGTTFRVDAGVVKIVEEKDLTAEQWASYRSNVKTYMDEHTQDWKARQAQ